MVHGQLCPMAGQILVSFPAMMGSVHSFSCGWYLEMSLRDPER